MKRFLRLFLTFTVIFLICLVIKLNILDFSIFKVDEQRFSNYSGYYFNQLDISEKEIYIKIDDAVKSIRGNVFLGILSEDGLPDKIEKILTAYLYDNPEIYYVSNRYIVSTTDTKLFEFSTLKLNYTISNIQEVEEKNKQLDKALNEFVNANITEDMTNFEKELAIHDALASKVSYFEYENIEDIPAIKHTAYGALVQSEAVCDGYSKAFKLLLDKVGIESIIINGNTNEVSHAWNIVNIEDNYYHVDVTSDKLDDTKKHVMHIYFNLNDDKISKTHIIGNDFNIPKCNSEKYEYYNMKGYYISEKDNIYNKLNEIIVKQKKSEILEIRVDKKHTSRRLIDTLYDLDFNNWYSDRKSVVEYTKEQDKYIFVK